MSRFKLSKIFNKRIKELNKIYANYDDVQKRYSWKKSWGPYIKYQADWDGFYLFDLILYKLERIYIELDTFSDEVREELDKKLAVLREVIDLGKKINADEYGDKSYEFLKEHTTNYILIYEGGEINISNKNSKLLHKVKAASHDYEKDMLGTKPADDWCKANGYKEYKDVHYAYVSEWDDDKNLETWRELIEKNNEEKQDDTNKFFQMIAKNYNGWWW